MAILKGSTRFWPFQSDCSIAPILEVDDGSILLDVTKISREKKRDFR